MATEGNGEVIRWPARVHIYELDSLGHVNNANYFPYLQQATETGWPDAPAWSLRHLSMEYLTPAHYGDRLEVAAWIETAGAAGSVVCGYAVLRMPEEAVLLRARLVWQLPDDGAGPVAAAAGLPDDHEWQLRPARPAERTETPRRFRWRHQVRRYETGCDKSVTATEVLRWTEEARARAAEEIGWTRERMQAADFVAVVTRHEVEFLKMPHAGDVVETESWIGEMRRVRGVWQHRLSVNGEPLARASVSGGFLNSAGWPHQPPQEMIDALLNHRTGS